jgi:osmoprotectant transport system substrate-binding protein
MRSAPRSWRQLVVIGLAIGLVATTLAACGGSSTSMGREQPDPRFVRVASFDFAESQVLAELFAQALEAKGIMVERRMRLGSREVVFPALESGLVDVVPEYLASSLEFVSLHRHVPSSAAISLQDLRKELASHGVSALAYASAVNRNAIAMSKRRARELGVETISDLRKHASTLNFIGPPECPERRACLPVLEERYGLRFKSFTPVEVGLPIALQLSAGEADVGVAFTSDPLVSDYGLMLLRPDREAPRAENILPLVRTRVLEQHDAIQAALEGVASKLTSETLRDMNSEVLRDQQPSAIAASWLRSVRLMP